MNIFESDHLAEVLEVSHNGVFEKASGEDHEKISGTSFAVFEFVDR